jgi:hypothetical protein
MARSARLQPLSRQTGVNAARGNARTGRTGIRKYRNIPTVAYGIKFDSKKEARRYGELLLLARAGKITNLSLQPSFILSVDGIKICTYVGDFKYTENGQFIVEDVKGIKTAVYQIKKKLMKAILKIDIRET